MILNILAIVLIVILAVVIIFSKINKRRIVSLFEHGNVIVSGMKGRGKDLLFCIVINARKRNYISNVCYSSPRKKYQHFDADFKVWELAGNDYTDLVTGEVNQYVYPYPDNIDWYISDSGIYFPAQYQGELCKRYKSAPMFQALSRQLGDCSVHCNVQNMPRVWDKIREQSDIFIRMHRSKVFFGKFCYLCAYVYSQREACENGIIPPRFGIGKTGKEARYNFEISHGKIQKISFLCMLPYKYDSRRFKKILENNCKDYEA